MISGEFLPVKLSHQAQAVLYAEPHSLSVFLCIDFLSGTHMAEDRGSS